MAEINDQERKLTCVLFPGVVKNDARAIECLGGIRTISQIYSQTAKKRLGLSYQPENPFVKRIFGECRKTAGILLKVRVKKTKSGEEIKKEVLSTTIVGRVSSIYKFENMCDFQYMPAHSDGQGGMVCHRENIIPSGLDSFDFLHQSSPLFILPAYFTRTDKPNSYGYTDKRYYSDKTDTVDADDNVHNRTRQERKGQFSSYVFSLTNELPTEPHEANVKQKDARLVQYPQLEEEYEAVKKLFDERPVWSFNLIKYVTKIRSTSLKLILPCLAIYLRKGPWKMVWLRFGYDPRKDPASRIYQTLDFRVRSLAGISSMVTTRGEYHYKKIVHENQGTRYSEDYKEVPEAAVMFKPGLVPTQRQVYYQYCDIKLPEVEDMLAAEPAPGYLCHQTRGWLPPNADQHCRDLIFRYVKQTLLSSHNADFKLEEGSSDDEGNSEDDDAIPSAAGDEAV
ncbi:general transcription factor 3C polypeptide 5 isoform X2 [Ostrinia furnacalis]|uniref:general transcription factor 3C polypeptide 5 isoform X2 n=1 Tax=Ostrinia furnacalis TaxID=93504 RepID=UPI00103FA16A|nr:general transcription factor 3C polypeptide 5 isoform X2 [Ostrinia furnacalis]